MANWYLQTGNNQEVVISSRVRLARNLSQFNFYIKSGKELLEEENLIKTNLPQIGYGLNLVKIREMQEIQIQELLEKGLITKNTVQNRNRTSILINDEENICILINDEDHLRLQVFASGMELEAISNLCIEIDERIQKIFSIAKSAKYGFLTTSPVNVGTGMKLSVAMHLPGLTRSKNMQNVIKFLRQFGIEITKEQNPDIYKISNEKTLGITEKNIITSLKIITEKIIEQEKEARKVLVQNGIELEDKICRSYGILSNCRKISQREAEELLSDIKLGTDLGIITDLTDAKVKKLYLYSKPANLSKYFGQEISFQNESTKRAEMIKKITKD